jgi:hypothetical protein
MNITPPRPFGAYVLVTPHRGLDWTYLSNSPERIKAKLTKNHDPVTVSMSTVQDVIVVPTKVAVPPKAFRAMKNEPTQGG